MDLLKQISQDISLLEEEINQIEDMERTEREEEKQEIIDSIYEKTDTDKIDHYIAELIPGFFDSSNSSSKLSNFYFLLIRDLYDVNWLYLEHATKAELSEKIKKSMEEKYELTDGNFHKFIGYSIKREKQQMRGLLNQEEHRYISATEEERLFGFYKEILIAGVDYYYDYITKEDLLELVFPALSELLASPYTQVNIINFHLKFVESINMLGKNDLKKKAKEWYQKHQLTSVHRNYRTLHHFRNIRYVLNKEQLEIVKEKEIYKIGLEYDAAKQTEDKKDRYNRLNSIRTKLEQLDSWEECHY